jgi:hypothetical protein
MEKDQNVHCKEHILPKKRNKTVGDCIKSLKKPAYY